MGDHLVLNVGRLMASHALETVPSMPQPLEEGSGKDKHQEELVANEEAPLIQLAECRICQEEDSVNNLEIPCACSGSLKYAHRNCVQRWCNEKGDITCEICHEPYKPGYTVPPHARPDETTINISGGWTIAGAPIELHDRRIMAMAAAQRHLLEAEYDEYAATNASGAAFCRSAALILMALLLLRHAVSMTSEGDDDDTSAYFSLFLLRVAGFLLPCYVMAWAISILHRRRQRQEAAAMAAAEVAFILQSGHARSLQFTIAPESPATPQQEPHQ
ncbi:E3 ubiquitin-protein ligase MARCH6 [Apostasia shenzhenica]|uniref:E3 ubiquitin-protein ligase MARCH6 n=1 Tax=Apostasia shenzhenica TaxID=1088818 RepID=A0A2I0AMI5_9ASPA|nr:E3 ubiquitin-protein ligase MARCH6 [Apostasia shenzhenica]